MGDKAKKKQNKLTNVMKKERVKEKKKGKKKKQGKDDQKKRKPQQNKQAVYQMGENICKSYISDKGLIFKIHKEFKY